jgi:hypothetical protein
VKHLLTLLVLLFAGTVHAEEPPPDDVSAPPPANGCAVRLGDAVTINGLHYVPVLVTNDYVRNIRNIWGWGSAPDLELTGTVAPAPGHLNGNYWPYTESDVYWSFAGGGWKMQIWGAWDLPRDGAADCASLPYPDQTTGVAAYLHFVGEGSVRINRLGMYSGNICNPPGIGYTSYQVVDRTVTFPPPDPGGGSGSGCPPGHYCEEGLTVTREEAPKVKPAPKPKRTWGAVKALYR